MNIHIPGLPYRKITQGVRLPKVYPWYLRPYYPNPTINLLIGKRGSGKTLSAVYTACRQMAAGRLVYANFEIIDARNGNRAGRIYTWKDTLDDEGKPLEACTFVIDEANLWLSSHKWNSVPDWLRSAWAQSRHYGVSMILTAQHEMRIEKTMREIVDNLIVYDRGFLDALSFLIKKPIPLFWESWGHIEDTTDNYERLPSDKKSLLHIPAWVYSSYNTEEIIIPQFSKDKDGKETEVYPPRREPSRLENGRYVSW